MRFCKLFIFFIAVLVSASAFAQSSAELKRRKDKLNDELEQLNREYQETASSKKVSIKQLNLLKAQINLRESKITTINSEIRNLDSQISENTNSVHSLQGQLDQLRKEYAGMILFAYHNKSAYNKLMFIFAAKDFNQAYKRLKYLQQFGTYRERQANYIQGTQKDLNVKINVLDRTKKEKSTLLEDQKKEKETLGKEKNTQTAVVNKLSKQQGYLKQQQKEKQTQLNRISAQISAAIRREIAEAKRKAEAEERARLAAERAKAAEAERNNKDAPVAVNRPKTVAKSSNSEILNATPEAAKLSSDFLGNRGSLPWPVANGNISQPFGNYYDNGIQSESTGVGIRTNNGATVRSVFNGTVSVVSFTYGTYTVIVMHGEYFTAYSNLKSVTVNKGDKLTTKQAIGTVATDASGESELHFELWKSSNPVNPKIWLAPD